eukprot:g5001.t1
MSMEERRKEIQVHRDLLRAELKVAEESRHRVTMDMKNREIKVNALRAKFETLAASRIGSADGGEEMSQAHFVIKAAQIREELQRKGDVLDSKIRTVEREIGALDATLKQLVSSNSTFRSGFQLANMKGEDAKKLYALEKKNKLLSNALFKKRKEYQRVSNEAEDANREMKQVNEDVAKLKKLLQELQVTKESVERDLNQESKKCESSRQKVKGHVADLRECRNVAPTEMLEEERRIRQMASNEIDENVLQILSTLGDEFPEIRASMKSKMDDLGLDFSERPSSRGSSTSSSSSSSAESDGRIGAKTRAETKFAPSTKASFEVDGL